MNAANIIQFGSSCFKNDLEEMLQTLHEYCMSLQFIKEQPNPFKTHTGLKKKDGLL